MYPQGKTYTSDISNDGELTMLKRFGRQMDKKIKIFGTTSNGEQFTVTREMLTAVARDQSVQLKVA